MPVANRFSRSSAAEVVKKKKKKKKKSRAMTFILKPREVLSRSCKAPVVRYHCWTLGLEEGCESCGSGAFSGRSLATPGLLKRFVWRQNYKQEILKRDEISPSNIEVGVKKSSFIPVFRLPKIICLRRFDSVKTSYDQRCEDQ